jgi:LPS export ABC transporter protein LptC
MKPIIYCQGCFAALAFIYLSLMTSCSSSNLEQNKKEWVAIDTLEVAEKTFDAVITYTDSGYLRAKLYAPLIERHSKAAKPFVELPNGLKADFYNTKKEIESKLTAGYGINYLDSRVVEVRDKVKVTNTKNETLKTEKLFWDQNTKEIYTDNSVEIITEKEKLYGQGMRAAQDFSAWKITKVTGVVSLE